MTELPDKPPEKPATARGARLALALACAALLASAAQWLTLPGPKALEKARSEDMARMQRRLNGLEDRIEREREELARLGERLGNDEPDGDTLSGRLVRAEDALAKMPGGANARFLWRVEQAEYFLRLAGAQEQLAGNSSGALAALLMADEHLRDAADPRLAGARKLLAGEVSKLRALPQIDTEGMSAKLALLGEALPALPRRQAAPTQFAPEPEKPADSLSGLERATRALKAAFMTIVSVRRTDQPTATLLTGEAEELLNQSFQLELQMARLALLRADARAFRAAIAAARGKLEKHFDTTAPAVREALSVLDELAAAPMPESLPDISASLTELLRVKERESRS